MTMKTIRWTLVAVALTALVAGCKDSKDSGKSGASASAAATGTSTAGAAAGGDACSQYIAALDACIAKAPKEQTSALKTMRDTQKKALESAGAAAKGQMQDGCKNGMAALKQNALCK